MYLCSWEDSITVNKSASCPTPAGSAQATLTSEAENEWDGDRSHGVGDYRIPIPLRQNTNGSAIPEADKFPNKGMLSQ